MNRIPENIWDQLITVAKEDGIISPDEETLLENIKTNLQTYYEKLEKSKIEKKVGLKVLEAQLNIMTDAYEVANQDNIISQDELELIKKLQIIVRKMTEDHE